jgi:hypothetical protein
MKKEVNVLKLNDLEEKSVCKNTGVKANNKRKTLFSKGNRDKLRGYIVIDIETCKGVINPLLSRSAAREQAKEKNTLHEERGRFIVREVEVSAKIIG